MQLGHEMLGRVALLRTSQVDKWLLLGAVEKGFDSESIIQTDGLFAAMFLGEL